MKFNYKIQILLFSIFLLSMNSYAQDEKIVITLTVDAETINEGNMDSTCSFGQPEGVSNEDYTTEVAVGDDVKWKIETKEGTTGTVRLVKFQHESGVKFFKKDSIMPSNNRIKGTIEDGSEGDTEKYTLEFKVKKRGESNWTDYAIDPKLSIIP